VDRQEIAREVEPFDQRQLIVELIENLAGNSLWPASLRTFPGEMLQMFLR